MTFLPPPRVAHVSKDVEYHGIPRLHAIRNSRTALPSWYLAPYLRHLAKHPHDIHRSIPGFDKREPDLPDSRKTRCSVPGHSRTVIFDKSFQVPVSKVAMGLLAKSLRAIVRNDAMRDDPDDIYNGRTVALVCCACFGGMLFGWDTGAIGGVLAMSPTREKFGYENKSKTDVSNLNQNIVSTLQAGCFAACLAASWFADRFGRRRALVGAGLLTIAGVVFQAASGVHGNLAVMYVGRFISGLGVGCASTVTPLYVSECCPRAIRGGLTAFYQLFNVFGIMLAFWINYGCLLHLEAPAVYIVPMALQAVPAVLPAKSKYVSQEVRDMAEQLKHERRLMGDADFRTLIREMWLVPANRKRAVITIVLMACQQLTGVNAI
ncbi:hypothetical protein E4U53_003577, partial [Claviceps sorghi]